MALVVRAGDPGGGRYRTRTFAHSASASALGWRRCSSCRMLAGDHPHLPDWNACGQAESCNQLRRHLNNSVLNVRDVPFVLSPRIWKHVKAPIPGGSPQREVLPNLLVNIVERRPLSAGAAAANRISGDGIAFKPRGEVLGLISVVALSGPKLEEKVAFDPMTPAPFISSEMVLSLQGLASHVPPGVPILYDAGLGFGWNDPRGWRVYFGVSANDVELKIRVYESLADSLTQRGIRPALINVTYPTAPLLRMSQNDGRNRCRHRLGTTKVCTLVGRVEDNNPFASLCLALTFGGDT